MSDVISLSDRLRCNRVDAIAKQLETIAGHLRRRETVVVPDAIVIALYESDAEQSEVLWTGLDVKISEKIRLRVSSALRAAEDKAYEKAG